MDNLGVGYTLSPYENSLWSVYDDEQGITCSAEVRMGPDGDEIDAELQMVYENPPEGKEPLEQIFIAQFKPAVGSKDKWDHRYIKIKGHTDEDRKKYNYEEKACKFFDACVQELKMGLMPDIDALLEREMKDKERFSDQYGGGSSKAPKIQAQQLLGMKNGRGM